MPKAAAGSVSAGCVFDGCAAIRTAAAKECETKKFEEDLREVDNYICKFQWRLHM
jgi:hypothetical protein